MNYNKEGQGEPFASFVHTLEQLTDIVARLTQAETAKAEAASAKEHKRMDSFLKEEQALLLKMRGLEQQRDHCAAALGWKDMTFPQILDAANEEETAVLSPVFARMEQNLTELTAAKEAAGRIISVRLREFETLLGANQGSGEVPSYFHDKYV